MATATFGRSLTVKRSPPETWQTLIDVELVAGWVSVIEGITELEPLARYEAVLKDQVGPFKLRADLEITCPRVEPGRLITIAASGEDRQIGSRIDVAATLELAPSGDGGTTIEVSGTYAVAGRAATLGAGTINRKAAKIIEQFFTSASDVLGAG